MNKLKSQEGFLSFEQFSEARKNPEMNPKTSINDIMLDFHKKAKKLAGTSVKNAFVSYTQLDKLGINPRSNYDTPLGIYAYPLDYVKKALGKYASGDDLPFAGNAPFANLFSVNSSANILDLTNMTQNVADIYNRRFRAYYFTNMAKYDKELTNEDLQFTYKEILMRAKDEAYVTSPAGIFWNATRIGILEYLMPAMKKSESSFPLMWNVVFREMDIDGFVDMGKGIIHSNEPNQAVFFSRQILTNISRHNNKYSPDSLDKGRRTGNEIDDIKKSLSAAKTDDELITLFKNTSLMKFMKMVKHLPNPSETVQMYIISRDPYFIEYIKNPTEKVQMAAIGKKGDVMWRIKNPTGEAKELIARMKEKLKNG